MARLLFVQDLEYEYLGPMYLSSAARRAGHECRLALGRRAEDFDAAVRDFRPDTFGFSVMTGSHRWARETGRALRRRHGRPCLFGGAHPTFFPDFAREIGEGDAAVRGEGEDAFTDLLDRIDAGRGFDGVANVAWNDRGRLAIEEVRPLRTALDELAFPDRDLYRPLDGRLDRSVRTVLTSRGCPFHCSFCFEDAMRELYAGKGKYVRLRRIDRVIDECREVARIPGVRTIYFADDVFGMSRKWLYEFLPEYRREVGLPFVCLVRADIVAADPEYARRLADGGCQAVFFGIESGRERLRNEVLQKKLTDDEIVRGSKLLHDAGIRFRTYNILGLPGETLDDAWSTVELNVLVGADFPWCSLFAPYPGTALAELAKREGLLDADFAPDRLSKSFFTDTPLRSPHRRELMNLQKLFQTAVLWPRTRPLVKRMIRLPPNPLFDAWFGLVYLHVYARSERRDPLRTLAFAARNARHVLLRE